MHPRILGIQIPEGGGIIDNEGDGFNSGDLFGSHDYRPKWKDFCNIVVMNFFYDPEGWYL